MITAVQRPVGLIRGRHSALLRRHSESIVYARQAWAGPQRNHTVWVGEWVKGVKRDKLSIIK